MARIVIIAPGLWWAPEIAAAAEQLGHEVDLVGAGARHRSLRLPLRGIGSVAGRLPMATAPVNFSLGAAAAIASLRKAPHVWICWSSYALATELRVNAPIIVVRGSNHIRTQAAILAEAPRGERPSAAVIRLEQCEYQRATVVTVPTAQIAGDPMWRRCGGKDPLVVPYGFPAVVGSPVAPPIDAGARLIFGGAVGYRKGVDVLVGALAERPPGVASFSLFGRVSPNVGRLPDWWRCAGLKSRDAWMLELRRSHVLLLPSREEGMARVGLEAMAAGVPVIATPESGLSTWLQRGAGIELEASAWHAGLNAAVAAVIHDHDGFATRALGLARSWTWLDHTRQLLAAVGY